jgi:hypothetical protein
MDKLATQSWFSALSPTDKVIFLLAVLHDLTVAVRSIVHDYADDCETRSRLVYAISELNHRLTAAAWETMEGRETYPDDALIDMLFEGPNHKELKPYFPYVLEHPMQYLRNRGQA